jgi:putative effector of murein hydrolase
LSTRSVIRALPHVDLLVKFKNYDNNHSYSYIHPGQWSTRPVTRAWPWVNPKSVFKTMIIITFIFLLTRVNFYSYIHPGGQWSTRPVTRAWPWVNPKSVFKTMIIITFIFLLTRVNFYSYINLGQWSTRYVTHTLP